MIPTQRNLSGFGVILALLALGAGSVAAEALPPLRIEPSLLKGSMALKPSAALRQTPEASLPMPASMQKEPTATRQTAASPAGARGTPEHFLQIGAFSLRSNAEARLRQLASELGPWGAKLLIRQRDTLFLLQLGPWPDAATARNVRTRLRKDRNIAATYVAVPAPAGAPATASIPASAAARSILSR